MDSCEQDVEETRDLDARAQGKAADRGTRLQRLMHLKKEKSVFCRWLSGGCSSGIMAGAQRLRQYELLLLPGLAAVLVVLEDGASPYT